MPHLDADAPARDAIDEFLRHLADRDLSASTRRIRKTFLNEYLRHAQQAAADAGAKEPLTARELLEPERSAAWLADAADGKTRTRNTLRGPDAAAYPNSMRVRADTVNAFAEFIGEPARVDRQAPARGYHLTPGDTEKLLHELTVKRPIHANAMTALRTAAVAAVIADTGHGVPEIADLKLSALHLDGDEARAEIDGESYQLTGSTVHILTRWLAARGSLIAELEGSDPGYLWIPTKPGRPRGGVPSAKPGINPAAVRTLHASHRALVSQLLGTPLRPGALRAAALAVIPADDQELRVPPARSYASCTIMSWFLSWSRKENITGTPPSPTITSGSTSTPRPASSTRAEAGSGEVSRMPVGLPGRKSLRAGPNATLAPPPGGAISTQRNPSPNEAARRDDMAWIAYPKAGKLGTDLNRDTLPAALAGEGIQPVRQVAIDETWSALRFRPA